MMSKIVNECGVSRQIESNASRDKPVEYILAVRHLLYLNRPTLLDKYVR